MPFWQNREEIDRLESVTLADQTLRISRLGTWITRAGIAVAVFWFGIMTMLKFQPGLFAGQDWLLGMNVVAFLALGLIVYGVCFWASFRLAEKIADWSEAAEKKGASPLVTLAAASVFGFSILYLATHEIIAGFLSGLESGLHEGFVPWIFIMASPFLLFFAAAGIMAFHRSKPAHTAQEQMMMRKAEQRQTKILTFAIPFIIFVPYIIWVVLQPGPIVP